MSRVHQFSRIVVRQEAERYNPAMSEALLQILRPDGSINEGLEPPDIPHQDLLKIYRTMLLNRRVDERMITLQRQGRIGFYIASIGEEAAVLGSVYPLRDTDWIVPCYRELGAALYRGFPLFKLFCQLFGNSGDAIKGRQMPNHYSARELRFGSISSPVGTQIPQATGMAMAAKISGKGEIVLVFFGDGATSEGDFHVGANFAGVFKSPCVFVCRNNQWAISVPLESQTASESIAIKAQAYGFEGIRVDGNDVLAMVSATQEACQRARSGGGPTLVEAVTYRVSAHSTSDDPRSYREDDEVEKWKERDPLNRFRLYLRRLELWDETKELQLEEEIRDQIQVTIKLTEDLPPPSIETLIEDVFETPPWHLKEQLEELKEQREAVESQA